MNLNTVKALVMLLCVCHGYSKDQRLKVDVRTLGCVLGSVMTSVSGRTFQAFRGIPFAQPPVGDLRFRDPVPVKSWGDETLDATKEGPACIQYNMMANYVGGQEDCLVLNIYTPSNNYSRDVLPVMVWIHGGGWTAGSGNGETDFTGPDLILNHDVVLVTINYRLGPIGFLSTEDNVAPGNYGLLDQALALKWVQKHISNFGGNPDSVTIFGDSAGGASVEFQLLSPYSKGLFHRAIAQSGSAKCPWALQYDVGEYTKEVAEILNCPTSSSQELVDCLRTKDAEEIVKTREQYMVPYSLGLYPIAFGPRIDSERSSPFLPDDPAILISRKQFNSVPVITGVTENEGGLFAASIAADGNGRKEFIKDPIDSIRYSIGMEKRKNGYEIAKKVYEHYFVNNKNKEIYEQYGELESDYGFFKCVDESVDLLSRFSDNDVYYYSYAHRGQLSFLKLLNLPSTIDFGAVHADDFFVMFTNNMLPPLSDPNDVKVSKLLLDLWTSFATDGVPRSEDFGDWLPVKGGKMRYLKIQAPNPTFVDGPMPYQSKFAFWDRLFSSQSTKTEL